MKVKFPTAYSGFPLSGLAAVVVVELVEVVVELVEVVVVIGTIVGGVVTLTVESE